MGLFPGSFDPVHLGHLHIASACCISASLNEVWLLLSRHNPLKSDRPVLGEQERLTLLQAALLDTPQFIPCDVELILEAPSYTYRTLELLQKKYPHHLFHLILGEDTLSCFPQWKHPERFTNIPFLIYQRSFFSNAQSTKNVSSFIKQITYVPGNPINISSSQIRTFLYKHEDDAVRSMLPGRVYALIQENSYYKDAQR